MEIIFYLNNYVVYRYKYKKIHNKVNINIKNTKIYNENLKYIYYYQILKININTKSNKIQNKTIKYTHKKKLIDTYIKHFYYLLFLFLFYIILQITFYDKNLRIIN